jgi:hypothetical protein
MDTVTNEDTSTLLQVKNGQFLSTSNELRHIFHEQSVKNLTLRPHNTILKSNGIKRTILLHSEAVVYTNVLTDLKLIGHHWDQQEFLQSCSDDCFFCSQCSGMSAMPPKINSKQLLD